MLSVGYQSPLVLALVGVCSVVLLLDAVFGDVCVNYFAIWPLSSFVATSPLSYWRLFSHVLGHSGWAHMSGNLSFILTLGPVCEERYGSAALARLMAITSLVTGVLHLLLGGANTVLMGASGLVFMLILLNGFVSFRLGEIPLTFVLTAVLFLGKEIAASFGEDGVSQLAHIGGGVCGAVLGYSLNVERQKAKYVGMWKRA